MCGIAGFTGPYNDKLLHGMADALRHRGPDGEGYFFCRFNQVNLAHRRLSINDIEGGHQPMWNEDDTVGIVFNGEIYNHKELREDLIKLGHIFKTDHSDTEVLIHGYEEWSVDLLYKLNGMFAFCIYDQKNKRLFFARDRFGKKPLYYSEFNKKIAFASELKSLLIHPEVKKEIDSVSLQKYFGYGFIPAPRSLYKGVKKLPGGHYMTYDIHNSKSSVFQYWKYKVNNSNEPLKTSEDDLASELRELLTSAVKRRLIADVPVGIFLSGGIDSNSILACASSLKSSNRVKTFSIGFNENGFDESQVARAIAEKFDSFHSEKIFGINSAAEISPHVLNMLDEPMADSSILPTYLLAKFARQDVSVALGGDGGDELFAGYAPFKALIPSKIYCTLVPTFFQQFILKQVNRLPVSESYMSLDFKIKRTLQGLRYPPSAWNAAWLGPLSPNEISELMATPIEWDELYSEAVEAWDSSESSNLIDKTSEFYANFYLQDSILSKVDRATMMVGLEARSPFLDNDVVQFAQKIPSSLKLKRGVSKYILKKAMRGILPDSLLYKPKKGFGIPMTAWLKDWKIGNNSIIGCGEQYVKNAFAEHCQGLRDNRLFLWSWIVLQQHSILNIENQ
jgi:asparagine synthase (glutamine-hydrolysing)